MQRRTRGSASTSANLNGCGPKRRRRDRMGRRLSDVSEASSLCPLGKKQSWDALPVALPPAHPVAPSALKITAALS
jgi:hypothetical protein